MTVRTVERAAGYSETPWVIADPLPLMTAVYSVVYFDDHSLMDAGIADASSYDVLLWCAPDVPWMAEAGMRDGIDFRDRADQVITARISPQLPLHRISGSADERLASVLALAAKT
jgi:nicotinamide riboside kinase